jgi:hypothetical protein
MTDTTGCDFIGSWKTSKDFKVTITESIDIPAQKVWLGILENGQKVIFTQKGEPLFNDFLGSLIERRRSTEQKW